jgi:hypothetical protein
MDSFTLPRFDGASGGRSSQRPEIGECVLVDADGAHLNREELAEILTEIPPAKVRVIFPREHGTGVTPC